MTWQIGLRYLLALSFIIPARGFAKITDSGEDPSSLVENLADPMPSVLAKDLERLDEALEHELPTAPLSIDIFSLLNQKTYQDRILIEGFAWQDGVEKKYVDEDRHFNWNELTVKLVSEKHKSVFEQDLSEFTHENVGYGDKWKVCDGQSCRIDLTKEDKYEPLNSKVVHQFMLNSYQLAVVGPYIIFTSKAKDTSLKFIDLHSYENLIGRKQIPVFEIPIRGGITSLTTSNSGILINDNLRLSAAQLEDLSPIFSALFNVSANLVDPKSMAGATTLYANLSGFIEREFSKGIGQTTDIQNLQQTLISQEEFLKNQRLKMNLVANKTTTTDLVKKAEATVASYGEWLQESEAFHKAIKGSQSDIMNGRKLMARIRAGVGYISKPLPENSGVLTRAMKIMIGNTLNQGFSLVRRTSEVLEGRRSLSNLFSKGEVALSAFAISSMALAASVPDSYTSFVGDGLIYGKEVVSYFNHLLYGYWDSYSTSFAQVTQIYNPLKLPGLVYDQYIDIEKNRWLKFIIGSSVFTGALAFVLGGYHIPRRLWDLYKDKQKPDYQGLIARQNKLEKEFAHMVSEGEAKQRSKLAGGDSRTPEEIRETKLRLRIVQEDRKKPGFLMRFYKKLRKQSVEHTVDVAKIQESMDSTETLKDEDFQPIKTNWQAVSHLLFSTASYRATVGEYTGAFNEYAGLRYSSFGWMLLPYVEKNFHVKIPYMIKIRPVGIATRLLYPEFFKTATTKRSGDLTLPTDLNGGMRSLGEKAMDGFSKWRANRTWKNRPAQMDLAAEMNLISPEQMKRQIEIQEAFEDKIIDTEKIVIAEALKTAMGEMTKFSKNDRDLKWLFAETTGPVHITAREISLLSTRNKVFVRSYMDLVYNEAMGEILRRTVPDLDQETKIDLTKLTSSSDLKAMKKSILAHTESVEAAKAAASLSKDEVTKILARVTSNPAILEKAKKQASWAAMGLPSLQTIKNNTKINVAAALDGTQNPPMRNYEIVHKARKDEIAMVRATRNEIANLFRTLPLDIGMKFLATAGITMGLMAPMQDTAFGDNSVAYLSQYSFYGSLLAGIAFSSVSSAWGKLRQDHMDASAGLFGEIPQGEDAQKGYWSWFWKKWKDKDNSLWKYWGNYIDIVFWNIPAAIPQMILLNYLFLQRFDLDAFVIGYISAFTLPFSAFFMKLDQVFEQSSYYAARGLTEKDLLDVEVQQWLQKEMQRLRNSFTVKRDIALNPILEALGNATVTPTDSMGPRALTRYFFWGYTPTEIVVAKMRSVSEMSGSGFVKKVMDSCEYFLTNRNPDLIKLPPK